MTIQPVGDHLDPVLLANKKWALFHEKNLASQHPLDLEMEKSVRTEPNEKPARGALWLVRVQLKTKLLHHAVTEQAETDKT